MKFKYIFTLLFIVSFGFVSFGQENIEETKKIADDLFEEEKYIEATPYYLRLLAIQPRDHNFNYHYGACLLHNSGKSQDVFKYLNYAVTDPNVDAQANYFLGRAYHLNFQFNDAIKYYKIYQTKAADKAKPSFDVKRQIEMCENGKKLITTITEMIVLDKKEIEKDKFFRIYDLSDIGGNLLVTAEFQTKIDEKKAHVPLIHFPANPTVIYYSSYGENGKTGKDIYVQRRLPTGGWGLPQALKGDVNTNFDEDYPYMHPDGQYLYFSSKGHNSMGGFDVFRCKYDAETDMFGKAENMDFAVSSPNDDLFYVVDSLNKNAYFGSNRQSEEGKLFVYKVRVDRVPLNMSVIKGEFNSTINPQMKKVFIDVKDYSNGEFIGNFNSNEKGVYLITFPKGGKYEFTIKVGENKQEFKYLASIPFQKEFKPLKQKIIHEQQGDAENVRVIDLFNEEVEDPQGVFAQVIKMKSELKPNVSAEELARMDKELKDREILKVLGLDKLSLVEVGYLLDEKVKDAKKAEGGTKDIENKIYAQVIEHTTEIKRLDGLIKDKIEKANSAPNDKRKYKYLKEAERSLKIQEELKALNEKSLHLADSLSKTTTKGSSEVTAEIAKFSEHFNELMKENKQAEAYAYLADNKDDIKRIVETKNLDPLQELIERGLLLDEEIAKLQPKDDQYDRDIRKIDAEIGELERSKEGAKKKQIEEIDATIKAKRNERTMIAEERNFNGQGLNDKIAERSSIRKQVDVLEAIYAVQTPKVITKEELDAALLSSNSTNSTEIRSKISEQIAQLVLTSPDVKAVDYEDLEKDLGPVVSNSRSKSDRIKADATLSPQEKANRLKALDRELLGSINSEIINAEKALKSNPTDPELKRKLEALQSAKTLVSSSLDLPEGDDGSSDLANSSATVESNQTKVDSSTSTENPVNATKVDSNVTNGNTNQSSDITTNSSATVESNQAKVDSSNSNENPVNQAKVESNVTTESTNQSSVVIANTSSEQLDSKGKENLIENISSSYNETLATINSNVNLSETEKLKQLQSADKSLITSLDKEISSVEAALKSNPTDALLLKKLNDLKSVRTEIEAKVSNREKQLSTLAGTNSTSVDVSNTATTSSTTTATNSKSDVVNTPSKPNQPESTKVLDSKTKESLIESVNSTYNEKLAEINSNSSLSQNEKLAQLQQLDKSLLNSIDEVSSSITTSLQQNPANASLSKKLADLSIVKSEVQEKVNTRESQILTATATTTNTATNTAAPSEIVLDSKGKETIIESINSTYNEQVAEVNSNSSLSENEKLTQLQQLDEKLVLSINKQISLNENTLKLNPTDEVVKKKISDLKSIRSDLEIEMGTRESKLSSDSKLVTSTSSLDSKGKDNLIESINSTYNEKVNEINGNQNLSDAEKLNQLQLLDKELVSSLNKEIVNVSNSLKQNPTDANLIKKEADLKSVRTEVETIISARENALLASNQPLSEKAKNDIIDGLSPMYNVKVAEIKSNSKLAESDKTEQLQKADKELVSLINKEILALENNIKNNPDPQLIRDLSDLKKVKSELESQITAREVNSTSNSNSVALTTKEKEAIIESINSNYNENVSSINSNSSLSSNQKLDELSKLDKGLLSEINSELNKVEASLKTDSKNTALLKKDADLKTIKSDLEIKLNSSSSSSPEVAVTNENKALSETEKSNLIESINSTYNEKVNEINVNSILSSNEKTAKLQALDKELVTSISKEISKTESALKSDPSNDQLSKKEADLTELKSEIESKIAQQDIILASVKKPLDEKVKEEVIKSINSKYEKTVTSINNNTDLSVSEKLNKLQELDYSIIEGLNKEIKSTEEALVKNPNDKVSVSQLENLNAVKSEIEAAIASRESVIASSGSTIDAKVKSELIESVSSSYNEKVSEIKENEYLLDGEKSVQLQDLDKDLLTKVQSEIKSLEKSISENPSNAVDKRKLEGLKAVEIDVAKSISEREKLISPSDLDHALAKKAEVIEKFSPDYNEKVEEINGHALNSQVQKLEELQKLDQELLVQIKEQVKLSTTAAKKKSKDQELQKAKAEMIELQTLAENVIAERSKEIEVLKANSVTEKQKEELISEVKPDYLSNVDKIKDAKYDHAKELQELIKEEQSLVTSLTNNEEKVKSQVSKTPSDEVLKTKLNVAIATKLESQSKLDDLTKQAITLEAHDIDQTALLAKVDPTFESDILSIQLSNSSSKSSELKAREVKLQEKLASQVLENEKSLANEFNLEKAAENQILIQKIKESKEREEQYKNGKTSVPTNSVDPKALALRTEVLGKSAGELEKDYTEIDDLKAQENVVNAYTDVLKSKIEKNNSELASNPQDQNLKDQKTILESELKIADVKLNNIVAKLNALENSTEDSALSSPELKALIDKENLLKEQLANPALTKKEKSVLEKELKKVQVEKSIESNKLISENLTVRKADNEVKTAELQKLASTSEISKVNADLADSQNERLTKEADALIVKSDKTKDPIAKNELLTQAIEIQTKADEIVVAALEENITKAAIKDKVTTLDSEEELEEKKRNLTVEIEEIDKQVGELETQIAGLKPKKAVAMVEKKDVLITEKSLVEKQLEEIERQLTEIAEAPKVPKTVSEKALEQPVTFSEEKQIIASKEYMEYSINANKALRIEKQIAENDVVLTQKRQIAKETISKSLDKSSNVTEAEVAQSVENVKIVEEELKKLTAELEEKQKIANDVLAKNSSSALQMQNLVKRGVEPEFNENLAIIEQQRTPAVGLKVVDASTPINTYSASNPIPVNIKNPAGLVYRIQVGAFSKPIPQDMYKSFNPVSGEKLASGVTRYMAGYFNNSKTVDEAFSQVKALGYTDAFIVAYCDDERIALAEARKLELSGQCISTDSREFVIAMAKTPASKEANTNDLSYNDAPGAAKAIPAEAHLGLFYTVQVGVYNKPATPHQLKNIDPIVSKRLPNGQIRYSTGMFSSVDAAKPKKDEARGKGVKDAFVTAYYKGERLTLSQASQLLKQKGEGILEKIDTELLTSVSNKEVVKEEVVKTTPKVTSTKEEVSAYNKAPGAVPAKAVEAHLGLFFTVQIGVYSKPATSKQLNFVTPLITKKLPNGQLRYSSGMYSSIEAAEPKRKEILEKGVKHAYITAYYKGERITITEAKELLSTNGESILEKLEK